ncbi:MAG TPA: ATP-binding protein [Desulfobacteria bacterium]|nr:ATP-binding protein [Desulfobacteria bacterium]
MATGEMTKDKITATPTKRLFINILTKDISVKDCILDLIDNSVDSYIWNEIRGSREIRLNISKNQLEIFDTCGGIDIDFLKKDVFRFGADIERNKPTLGIYGIGMKRAMLKMGETILMETDDGQNYCKIKWNIDEWFKTEGWDIPFEYGDSRLTSGERGYTKIVVNDLYESVKNKFDLVSFITEIKKAIHITYTLFIVKDKIDFYVNDGVKIEPYLVQIRSDDHQYEPAIVKDSFNGVDFEIICFIDPHERRTTKELGKRGWNIFCNKRLILAEGTTETTGWSGEKSDLPKFHPIYNRLVAN